MKALRIFSICLLTTLFAACGNDRGPENDPSIEITKTYMLPGKGFVIVSKTCTFEAVIIEDEFDTQNRIKVLAPWGEKFWVRGNFSGPVNLETSKCSSITLAGYTSIQFGKYVWNYSIQG